MSATGTLKNRPGKTRLFLILGLVALLAVGYAAIQQLFSKPDSVGGQGEKPGTKIRPVPVVTAQAVRKTVPLSVQVFGNTQSLSSVSVKPQIDGQILRVLFKEGDFVKAGQILFEIDPRPQQALVNEAQAVVNKDLALVSQAQANLRKDEANVRQVQASMNRDKAQLDLAKAQERRYASLFHQDFISREQYEQVSTTVQTSEATIASDQAAVENARALLGSDQANIQSARASMNGDQAALAAAQLKLSYCQIRAPFTGRTGAFLVHEGDAVQTSQTSLVSLDQIDPIFVSFAVPEQILSNIKTAQQKGTLKVMAALKSDQKQTTPQQSVPLPKPQFAGKITFIDNTVDTTTGTIRLKGLFENPEHRLWPGQFASVTLMLDEVTAVLVPSQAVLTGQKGNYLYVVQAGKVDERIVRTGPAVNGETIIEQGLNPGEWVVTDGQAQLAPGFYVRHKK